MTDQDQATWPPPKPWAKDESTIRKLPAGGIHGAGGTVLAPTPVDEHVRGLVANLADPKASESVRAQYARTAADLSTDLEHATRLGDRALSRGIVKRLLDGDREFFLQREQLEQLRSVIDAGDQGRPLLGTRATGYGPAPLVRRYATPLSGAWNAAAAPVVPGLAEVVDPDETGAVLPLSVMDPADFDDPATDVTMKVTDVGGAKAWHVSGLAVEESRQLRDFGTGETGAWLDQLVLDDVDLRAELWLVGQLNAAAGGTTAVASGDVAAALEAGEAAAGAAGPVVLMVVHPTDLPAVRAAVPAVWADMPHPEVVVSSGQTAGTVTFVGYAAVHMFRQDYVSGSTDRPRTLGRAGYVLRPVYFALRRAAGVHKVTGV